MKLKSVVAEDKISRVDDGSDVLACRCHLRTSSPPRFEQLWRLVGANACSQQFVQFLCKAELGLPGLAGFWGEFFAVLGSFRVYQWAGFAVLGIVITAAYFLWTVEQMFLGPLRDEYKNLPDMNLQEHVSLWPPAVLTFLVDVYPPFMLKVIQPAIEHVVELMARATGGLL